jgi:hypothetical protein
LNAPTTPLVLTPAPSGAGHRAGPALLPAIVLLWAGFSSRLVKEQ